MTSYGKTATPRTSEIRALTGLRGIASIWVMLGHQHASHQISDSVVQRALDHKGLAVDLFLMLSGFVLAMAYGQTDGHGRRWIGIWPFLRNRLARIYPLYFLSSAACFILIAAGWLSFGHPQLSFGSTVANTLMVQAWGSPYESFNAPGWSISTEWASNLIFPALISFLLLRSRRVAISLGSVAFLCLVLIAYLVGGTYEGHTVTGSIMVLPEKCVWALVRNVCEFAIGILCWRISLSTIASDLAGRNLIIVPITILVLGLTIFPQLDIISIFLFIPLIIGLAQDTNIVAKILGSSIIRFFGVISFSIYLVHVPAMPLAYALRLWLEYLQLPYAKALGSLLQSVFPIAIAYGTYLLIELPGQKVFRTRRNVSLSS